MKIYFAYRSGYLPNNRYFKTFEADSIFDWFLKNWATLSDETEGAVKNLLGVRPYGFPVSDYQTEKPVPAPRDLEDLKEKIESFVYSNEVIVSENCVQVFTDDDEIELAWYVFDEKFAAENPGKVSVWFNDVLPTKIADELSAENLKGKTIIPKAAGQGSTYYLSSSIYDSSHIEDLEGSYRFEGVSLPELAEYLRKSSSLDVGEDSLYGLDEIRLLQMFAKLFSDKSQKEIFEEINLHSFNGLLYQFKFEEISPEMLEKIKIREANSKHTLNYSEHLIEISNEIGEFYNYTILFDDYWLKENADLGKSLAAFCSDWKI